jgi:hypothetical protein
VVAVAAGGSVEVEMDASRVDGRGGCSAVGGKEGGRAGGGSCTGSISNASRSYNRASRAVPKGKQLLPFPLFPPPLLDFHFLLQIPSRWLRMDLLHPVDAVGDAGEEEEVDNGAVLLLRGEEHLKVDEDRPRRVRENLGPSLQVR